MKETILNIEVYEKKPDGFNPMVQVAACYIEIDDKLLLLQATSEKLEPETWGVPAGKLEKNENPEDAARRELFEETGISIEHRFQMQSLGCLYIRKPEMDYVYHLFKIKLDDAPNIQLSHEHQSYKWASSNDLEKIPLMSGAKEALKKYRKSLNPLQAILSQEWTTMDKNGQISRQPHSLKISP